MTLSGCSLFFKFLFVFSSFAHGSIGVDYVADVWEMRDKMKDALFASSNSPFGPSCGLLLDDVDSMAGATFNIV